MKGSSEFLAIMQWLAQLIGLFKCDRVDANEQGAFNEQRCGDKNHHSGGVGSHPGALASPIECQLDTAQGCQEDQEEHEDHVGCCEVY